MFLDFSFLPDWILYFVRALVIGGDGMTPPQWLPPTLWM